MFVVLNVVFVAVVVVVVVGVLVGGGGGQQREVLQWVPTGTCAHSRELVGRDTWLYPVPLGPTAVSAFGPTQVSVTCGRALGGWWSDPGLGCPWS